MVRFDWLRFCKQHRIDYVTSGPNTSKGRTISIRCPFCGEADPSQHMGLSLSGPFWGCLRNAAHRGKSPTRLIQQLLRCSPEEARRISGVTEELAPTQDELGASFDKLRRQLGASVASHVGPLKLPPEFKPLMNGSRFADAFIEYLAGRGYREKQIEWLAKNYDLHYATSGSFAYRLIIPIKGRYGDLLTWTARTIQPDVEPRYKTLRVEPYKDEPVAKLAANSTILGLPLLHSVRGKALIVVEGPFDALKVTAFGQALGVYATSLFGLNAYPAQIAELQDLSRNFDALYLLIDEDAVFHRLRLLSLLAPLGCRALKMPEGADDPGSMTGADVVNLAYSLAA